MTMTLLNFRLHNKSAHPKKISSDGDNYIQAGHQLRMDSRLQLKVNDLNFTDPAFEESYVTMLAVVHDSSSSPEFSIDSKICIAMILFVSKLIEPVSSILTLNYTNISPVALMLKDPLQKVVMPQGYNVKLYISESKSYNLKSEADSATISLDVIKELEGLHHFLSRFDIDSNKLGTFDGGFKHYEGFCKFKQFANKSLLKNFHDSNPHKFSFDQVEEIVDNYIFDHFFEISGVCKKSFADLEFKGEGSNFVQLPDELIKNITSFVNPTESLWFEREQTTLVAEESLALEFLAALSGVTIL